MKDKDITHLRAHHINCIFFFKGLGYSENFTKKMTELRDRLVDSIDEELEIVIGADDLCSNCPHLACDNSCISDIKVNELDKKTIEEYNLTPNNIYSMKYIKENIYKDFNQDKFKRICSNCQWYKEGICNESFINELKSKWE